MITVVSLPLVNQWTQDRRPGRTPQWRGIPPLHEVRAAGVPLALASDNTRDQFYAYGDLDMLEVLTQSCRMAHLDRPYEDWARSVTAVPAAAMRLGARGRGGTNLEAAGAAPDDTPTGTLRPGGPADFVIFRGRCYSELMSRPQGDRVVIRAGRPIDARPPAYEALDDLNLPSGLRSFVGASAYATAEPEPEPAAGADGRVARLLFKGLARRRGPRSAARSTDAEVSPKRRRVQLAAYCDAGPGAWDEVVAATPSGLLRTGPWGLLGRLAGQETAVPLAGVLALGASALAVGAALGFALGKWAK